MKYLYLLLASFLVISSCKEEDIIIDPDPNQPSFTCTIDGNNFSDNTPTIDISSSDIISISSVSEIDGVIYTIEMDIKSMPFNSINEGETIYFSSAGMGVVNYSGSTYSNTYNGPSYDGEIVFTTKSSEKLSGTFIFKAQDVDPSMFTNVWVTDGVFENISY